MAVKKVVSLSLLKFSKNYNLNKFIIIGTGKNGGVSIGGESPCNLTPL